MVWLHHKKAVHLHHKGCTQGGALVSSAPTKQRIASTALLVQLGQLHPLRCTNQQKNSANNSVGAAGTAAPPKVHQPSRERPNNNK